MPFDQPGPEKPATDAQSAPARMADAAPPGPPQAALQQAIQPSLDLAAGQLSRALRRRLSQELRGALEAGTLALHYQPRVTLDDGRACGAEALLRWNHAKRGNIPPGLFIPIAEASDLITDIGGWVLKQATKEAAGWLQNPAGRQVPAVVSVNVSARQLRGGVLLGQVARALEESGLPPERLELELTESMLVDGSTDTLLTLAAIRDLGVGLALDDFGTGYASLSVLKRLPLNTLKLDRAFVRDLPHDAEDTAIVRAVQSIARALKLDVVAEGVETEDQRAFLSGIGCGEAQGYLFGRPAAAEHLRKTLREG
jgi:EAL domain-containing protein (putative c-di-GMP-specific phosphodiesterase class I)